jgi:hypothetical protein
MTPRTLDGLPDVVLIDHGRALPVPHDFPFPICTACGFPIPAHDLSGSEILPCHASTCQPTPLSTDHQEVSR